MLKKGKSIYKYSVQDIVETGILVAFAVVLDTFVKIPLAANGGSINIAMVPLLMISLRKGWFKGFIAGGITFGLLSCFLDGYGFVSFPFDYLLGFGSVAIFGLFKDVIKFKEKEEAAVAYLLCTLGITLTFAFRFLASTFSGMIFYGLDFGASALYNITYLSASYALVLAIFLVLLKPLLTVYKQHN